MPYRNKWLVIIATILLVSTGFVCLAQEAHADSSAVYTAVVLRDFPLLYQTEDEDNPAGYAIDLKRESNELLALAGKPLRYPSAVAGDLNDGSDD